MKNRKLALGLVAFLSFSQLAQALDLRVIQNYDLAETAGIWEKVKPDMVPVELLGTVTIGKPSFANGNLFPKTFLQEELFVVCHKDCEQEDILKIKDDQVQNSNEWNIIEQSNVYFWLNSYFKFLDQELNFRPDQYLKVTTNRNYVDALSGDAQKNNAFFSPLDMSLSFLPASKSLLFKILQGKINRSGFDPSVVVHEASHYIFHHLFPHAVNKEIAGLNEGFADYLANVFLENPKVGLIMLRGKPLRNSASPIDSSNQFKTYSPKMESHDLGERVTYTLWMARSVSTDKREMDRLVIDAVLDLARNPYSAIHDFKEKMLERLPSVVPSHELANVETIFHQVFEGESHKVANRNFLNSKLNPKDFVAYTTRLFLTPELAKETKRDEIVETKIAVFSAKAITEDQTAVLLSNVTKSQGEPHWIVTEKKRDNILGAFDSNNTLVTDPNEVKELSPLLGEVKNASNFKVNFIEATKDLADLTLNQGKLSFFYKVKNPKITTEKFTFNNQNYTGRKIEIQPKRKLLTGIILGSLVGGLPPINKAIIYTIPEKKSDLAIQSNEKVIGYRLTLESGIEIETVIDSLAL